jgi:hypothetical protein
LEGFLSAIETMVVIISVAVTGASSMGPAATTGADGAGVGVETGAGGGVVVWMACAAGALAAGLGVAALSARGFATLSDPTKYTSSRFFFTDTNSREMLFAVS